MSKRYYVSRQLTEEEQWFCEQLLLEQLEIQCWYAVIVLEELVSEILITLN